METMDGEGERQLIKIRDNDAFVNSRGEYDLRGIDSDMEDYMSRSGYQNPMTDSGLETAKLSNLNDYPVKHPPKKVPTKGKKNPVGVRTVGGESFTDEDYGGGSDFDSVKIHEYNYD